MLPEDRIRRGDKLEVVRDLIENAKHGEMFYGDPTYNRDYATSCMFYHEPSQTLVSLVRGSFPNSKTTAYQLCISFYEGERPLPFDALAAREWVTMVFGSEKSLLSRQTDEYTMSWYLINSQGGYVDLGNTTVQ